MFKFMDFCEIPKEEFIRSYMYQIQPFMVHLDKVQHQVHVKKNLVHTIFSLFADTQWNQKRNHTNSSHEKKQWLLQIVYNIIRYMGR